MLVKYKSDHDGCIEMEAGLEVGSKSNEDQHRQVNTFSHSAETCYSGKKRKIKPVPDASHCVKFIFFLPATRVSLFPKQIIMKERTRPSSMTANSKSFSPANANRTP